METTTRRPYAPICHWPPALGDLGLHHVQTFHHRGACVDATLVARHYGTAMLTRLLRLDTFGRLTLRTRRFYAGLRLEPGHPEFLELLERSITTSLRGTHAVLGGPQAALESVCSSTTPGFARELYGVLTTLRDPGDDLSGGYRIQTTWAHGVSALCYLAGAAHPSLAHMLDTSTRMELEKSALTLAYDEVLRAVEHSTGRTNQHRRTRLGAQVALSLR